MRRLTASDRSALIKLASSLPAGSPERKAILAGLRGSSNKTASNPSDREERVERISQAEVFLGRLQTLEKKLAPLDSYCATNRFHVSGSEESKAFFKKCHGIINALLNEVDQLEILTQREYLKMQGDLGSRNLW
jgi:hypothetical protein